MYYIYEIEMPEADYRRICKVAEKAHLSLDELFARWVEYMIDHPEELRQWHDEFLNLPEEQKRELEKIRLIRYYPVMEGQTENETREAALQKEAML